MIKAKCYKDSDPKILSLQHDLEVGKLYDVDKIDISTGQTNVYLMRRQKLPYNGIFFEFFEDGKPINIYKDKRFNPCLK